jgi:hypothetical protein
MNKEPNVEQIAAEIEALREIKPRVRHFSSFGDDHRRAIEAQIEVLENAYTEDEVDEEFVDFEDNIKSSALDAANWLTGDHESERLVDDWKSLVKE